MDGEAGKITIPPGAYTGDTFAAEVQKRVNLIETEDGRKVSGVEVRFDIDSQRFTFTSGTASQESFINVNGHPNFGLSVTTQEWAISLMLRFFSKLAMSMKPYLRGWRWQ